ncbi:MAG: M1 family aminopeptidase [Acidobacteriota bacterium]|nr:M1 family aminopeptidase [Acidobacteriota bacterium]
MVILVFCLPVNSWTDQTEFPSHLRPIKIYLEHLEFEDYLSLFSPELRQNEKDSLTEYFKTYGYESVSVFFSGQSREISGQNLAFFQIMFRNQFSATIEIWQIIYEISDSSLIITDKKVIQSSPRLYRLHFPGKSNFPVKNLSLTQQDLTVTFSRARVFLDNLPETNTAMIIIGQGKVIFRPSDEIERNQLQKRFKKPYFETSLSSVYVRASPDFLKTNLNYEITSFKREAGNQADDKLVASIFARNYPRSFTVENSLTEELLTFMPQSDETVVDMQTVQNEEFTYAFSPFAEEEIVFLDRKRNWLLNSYSPAEEEAGLKKMFIQFGEKSEIKDYEIEVSYNPATHFMSARAELKLISATDNLEGLQLVLNPELQIREILDNQNRQLYYTRDRLRKFLYVYLTEGAKKGQAVSIYISYQGKIVPPPPLDDAVAGQQTRTYIKTSYKESYLFTQSSNWYPAPAKKNYFTFKLKLFIPDDCYGLASGRLVDKQLLTRQDGLSEKTVPGNYVYIYEGRVPVKYISFFVGHLKPGRKISGVVELEYFETIDLPCGHNILLEEAKRIFEFYEGLFGHFPYEHLSVVRRYWPTGGGVSPPGYIVLNENQPGIETSPSKVKPDSPVDLSYWEGYYLAHEMAHQWWGHGITYASYRDIWLTEGLSQFAAILYLQKKYGQKALEEIQGKIARWVNRKSSLGPVILGARLSRFDFKGYQAIVYNRAALALFMLKDLLGEELFFKGLKNFYQKNLYKSARTSDFRQALEETSGLNLKQFFQDWFYSEALPEITIKKKISREGDSSRLELVVSQLKKPVFFPLRIVVSTDQGYFVETLKIKDQEQTFNLQFPGKLKGIKVNPGHQVPGSIK